MSENFSKNQSQSVDPLPVLPIAGITPFTTIDFPGRLSAVFYTQGCPWRCHYCFNHELQAFSTPSDPLDPAGIIDFLDARKGLLDAIVFSGGEASFHDSLREWMLYVKKIGYKVGLHTAGIYPEKLKTLVDCCDWIGLDIKAPFDEYQKITQVRQCGEKVRESARIVLESGIAYEFRTTVHPDLLQEKDILLLASQIYEMGVKNYCIQVFKNFLDRELPSCSGWQLSSSTQACLERLFPSFTIRS